MKVHFTPRSGNSKTGDIPVTISASRTCPSVCPFRGAGCYADIGPLMIHWRRVDEGRGISWLQLCKNIAALPEGTVWRHNQAGDLPGDSNTIDRAALRELVSANRGRRGFTYTHKPLTQKNISAIRSANQRGFTVNLSANNLAHADELVAKDVGPVTVVLPAEQTTNTVTPAGNKVVVCPATTHEDVTCKSCELCAISTRKVIVGFPAHGTRKRQASEIARG
jgi:hypothetical protein